MRNVYDFNRLTQLLHNLYIITGQKFTLKSSDAEDITTGHSQSEFCRLIQSTVKGYKKCKASDKAAVQCTRISNRPYMSRCHCALIETTIPIMNGDMHLAYLMFGQVLDDSDLDKQWEITKNHCAWHNDLNRLKEAFYQLHRLSRKQLEAYTDILAACASYIWLQDYVRQSELSDAEKIKEYINQYYDRNLSIKVIAHALGMSKTKLCQTARKAGITVNTEIKIRRMKAAKEFIATADRPLSSIAEAVGISDYSYFCKLFKSHTGKTPGQYRKTQLTLNQNTNLRR